MPGLLLLLLQLQLPPHLQLRLLHLLRLLRLLRPRLCLCLRPPLLLLLVLRLLLGPGDGGELVRLVRLLCEMVYRGRVVLLFLQHAREGTGVEPATGSRGLARDRAGDSAGSGRCAWAARAACRRCAAASAHEIVGRRLHQHLLKGLAAHEIITAVTAKHQRNRPREPAQDGAALGEERNNQARA